MSKWPFICCANIGRRYMCKLIERKQLLDICNGYNWKILVKYKDEWRLSRSMIAGNLNLWKTQWLAIVVLYQKVIAVRNVDEPPRACVLCSSQQGICMPHSQCSSIYLSILVNCTKQFSRSIPASKTMHTNPNLQPILCGRGPLCLHEGNYSGIWCCGVPRILQL